MLIVSTVLAKCRNKMGEKKKIREETVSQLMRWYAMDDECECVSAYVKRFYCLQKSLILPIWSSLKNKWADSFRNVAVVGVRRVVGVGEIHFGQDHSQSLQLTSYLLFWVVFFTSSFTNKTQWSFLVTITIHIIKSMSLLLLLFLLLLLLLLLLLHDSVCSFSLLRLLHYYLRAA